MTLIIIDLKSSLADALRNYLSSKSDSLEQLLREYFVIKQKKISKSKRKIYFSKELKQHQLYVGEKNKVIHKIADIAEEGGELNLYLSVKSSHLAFTDKALATFGVHHFHLGSEILNKGKDKGLIKRTKSLLFARVTEDEIFFVNIYPHADDKSFLKTDILRIVHRNWPWSISDYRLNRVGVEEVRKMDDEEIGRLLASDINMPIPIDEAVYFLPGGGLTAAGTSGEVEFQALRCLDEIDFLERILKENTSDIINYLSRKKHFSKIIVLLNLVVLEDGFAIYEKYSNTYFVYESGRLIDFNP